MVALFEVETNKLLTFWHILGLPTRKDCIWFFTWLREVMLYLQLATIIEELYAKVALFSDIDSREHLKTNFTYLELWNIKLFPTSIFLNLLFVVVASQIIRIMKANVAEFVWFLFRLDRNFGEIILLMLTHFVWKVVKRKFFVAWIDVVGLKLTKSFLLHWINKFYWQFWSWFFTTTTFTPLPFTA